MPHFKEIITFFENSSSYYIIIVGTDGTYTYVSPNYNKNFDTSTQSLTGKPFYITMHPDDVNICIEAGTKCYQNPGQLYPISLRKIGIDGSIIFTQWEFKALFDENNNPDGIFCIGYNITEHVDTHSKLVNANSEIERKTDRLNQISYIQSHGIRKPLANIMGLTTIISSMDDEDNLQSINQMLIDSAYELDDVIKNIVDRTVYD